MGIGERGERERGPGVRASVALVGEVWRAYAFERILPGGKDEKTCAFAGCGDGRVYGGGQCVCAAGGTGGKCGAGPVAGCESGERVFESGSRAIREEHGGSGGSDAG